MRKRIIYIGLFLVSFFSFKSAKAVPKSTESSISSRINNVRSAFKEDAKSNDGNITILDIEKFSSELTDAWVNWGNWGNWGNWDNWSKWSKWDNWVNWGNRWGNY